MSEYFSQSKTLLLRNVRIVTTGRVVDRGSVLVEDGRVARIAEAMSSEKLRADSEVDLTGNTLFPGFIDVHIHGAMGVDTLTAGSGDLTKVAQFLARHGVTGWLPTLVPASADQYGAAVSAIGDLMGRQDEPALPATGARILGVHYEGPFVNSAQCGALHGQYFRSYKGAADLDALPVIARPDAVHMMTLAPEIDGGIDLVSELVRRNWVASIGHTQANVETLDRARNAGARHMTHFMNAMAPLHHRNPGPIGWGLMNDEVTCDVIADRVHVDPLMLGFILRQKGAQRLSLISDAIAATGLGDGEYQIWGETIGVEGGRTRNRHGNIAGSVITMRDAVQTMLSLGVPEPAVARMASLNPARLLRVDSECGSIEEGKRADLVALNGSGEAVLTVIGGQVHDPGPAK